MLNQSLSRDPHRYQPEDQFGQNPVPQAPIQPGWSTPSQPAAQVTPSEPLLTQAAVPAEPTLPPVELGQVAVDRAQTESTISQAPPISTPTDTTPAPAATRPTFQRPDPRQPVLEWTAPSRPHKKRHKQYYMTIAAILGLVTIILVFAGQFIPIVVLLAGGFLVYVMEMVPPAQVRHGLTGYGLLVEGTLYYWEELGRFWFTQRHGQTLLHVETARFPNRLTILLGNDMTQEEMTELLSVVLINEQPPLSPLEKAGAWLEKTLPLDTD